MKIVSHWREQAGWVYDVRSFWTKTEIPVNMQQIYIPRGFAHGFVVLSEEAEFLYKCSDFYDPASEHGVHWGDPQLAID